jgi:hypothetical protein
MEEFPKDSVPELNKKNLGNSPRFLTNTHMTLSAEYSQNNSNFDDRCRY